jgi:hypothetical protein
VKVTASGWQYGSTQAIDGTVDVALQGGRGDTGRVRVRIMAYSATTGRPSTQVGTAWHSDIGAGSSTLDFSVPPPSGGTWPSGALLVQGTIMGMSWAPQYNDVVFIGGGPLGVVVPETVEEGLGGLVWVLQAEDADRTVVVTAQPQGVASLSESSLEFTGNASDALPVRLTAGPVNQDTTVTITASDGTNTESGDVLVLDAAAAGGSQPSPGEWEGLWSADGAGVAGQIVRASVFYGTALEVYLGLEGGAFGADEANLRAPIAADGAVDGTLKDTTTGNDRGSLAGTVVEDAQGRLVGDLSGTVDGAAVTVRFTIDPATTPGS